MISFYKIISFYKVFYKISFYKVFIKFKSGAFEGIRENGKRKREKRNCKCGKKLSG
jgi:hypothetical protein